jgi:large subunit ribosomal protein L10
MSKFIKGLIQSELKGRFDDLDQFMVIQITGLDGISNNAMRGELRQKGIRMTMVKNSLMRGALEGLGHSNAADLFQDGSCTVVYGGDSVVDVAKEIVDYAKKFDAVQVKGAYIDGEILDDRKATALSKMPSRAELQAEVVMLAQAPGRNLAAAITGPATAIAGCVKSLVEKLEKDAA